MKLFAPSLCLWTALWLTACEKDPKFSEVSMNDLRMKEDGRYYGNESRLPFAGIGFHEKNGARISQSNFIDGFREGKHLVFWPETGKKRTEGNYSEGFRDGIQTEWSEEGTQISESTYRSGTLEGRYRTMFPDSGALQQEGNYLAGKRNGTWTTYYNDPGLEHQEEKDRRKAVEATYKNGQLDGMQRRWTIQGALISQGEYTNGQMAGLHETFYPSGIRKDAASYEDGRISGSYQEWYDNGQMKYNAYHQEDGTVTNERFWDVEGNELDEPPGAAEQPLPEIDESLLKEYENTTP